MKSGTDWIDPATLKSIEDARDNADVNSMLAGRGLAPVFNHLAAAAIASDAVKVCVREGRHDEAWTLLHVQQGDYIKHANAQGFTAEQTMRISAIVQEQFANILRIEKKHHRALVDVMYWVAAGGDRVLKKHQSKLRAYHSRCKFDNVSLKTVEDYVASQSPLPNFVQIQQTVDDWKNGVMERG